MIELKLLDGLAQKLYAALPAGLQHVEQDLQKTFNDILQVAFARLDLVTREEFDVQVKVLARTREKVDALEQQVKAMGS